MIPIKDYPFLREDSLISNEKWAAFRPSNWDVFRESMNFAFAQTPVVQFAEWMSYQFEPLNAEFETMGMTEDSYNYKEFTKQEISKDEWNPGPEGSMYYDERIQWREGLTGGRVEILTDSLDRDQFYADFLKNVGSWDGYRLGGFFVGGIPDPLALLPTGGALVRLGQTVKGLKTGAKATALQIGSMGGEAALYAAGANALIYQKRELFDQDWTYTEAGRDMLFAFGFGAGLGTFATVAKQVSKLSLTDKAGNVFNSIRQIGQGKKIDVSPDAPRNSGEAGAGETPSPKAKKTSAEQTKENENVFQNAANKILTGLKEEGKKVTTDPTVGPVVEHVQDAIVNLTENLQDNGRKFFQLIKNCATKQ